MWFFKCSYKQLHWSAAVLKRFFNLVPVPTLVVVVLTLVSQFSKLLAFFLPLKVIILIGSTGIPRYFPPSWAVYDRDVLVIALSVATLFFYLVYLLAEKMLAVAAEKGASGVVDRSSKLALFINQDEIASQAYQKLAASLATVVLSSLLALLFAIFYPFFLVIMVVYVVGVAATLSLITQRQPKRRLKLQENSSNLVSLLSGTGFLVLFAFMVVDFLLWDGVSFIVAIISLLLSRQLLNRLEGVIKDSLWLYNKKLQINAIFFTSHRLERTPENPRQRKFWQLLSLCNSPERLSPLLERTCGTPLDLDVICRWRQSGLPDILVFELNVKAPSVEAERFLLKAFGPRHRKAALNEADLLMSSTGQALPSPGLIGVDQLEGFEVHLFRLPVEEINIHSGGVQLILDRLNQCWQVEPNKGLVTRYCRSHSLLPQRLTPIMLDRLRSVAEAEQHGLIQQLSSCFDLVVAKLKSLPLVITNLGAPKDLCFVTESDDLLLAHWGGWALEPAGADFPLGKHWNEKLPALISTVAQRRQVFADISPELVRLSGYCNAFEVAFNKQRYADALDLVPDILDCLSQSKANVNQTGC